MNRQTSGSKESVSGSRAALYMRVSTGRQAEHDLSIPDQRSQLNSWCRAKGHIVVAEFIEAGASASDDRRPGFQQMIERACDGGHSFDLIVVHSYSRFFREAFEQEFLFPQASQARREGCFDNAAGGRRKRARSGHDAQSDCSF